MSKGFIALFGVGGSHKQEQQLVYCGAIQTIIEARVDLWHTTMWMHKTEQHSYITEISKQSSQGYSQCTLVRPER